MIHSFSTCFESAFFGIITSIASDHLFGQYPVSAVIDTITASISAIATFSVPAMISEKEGPKVLDAVPARIFFQLLMCSSVVVYPVMVAWRFALLGRRNS
jgi:hypothetical protein